MTANKKYPAPSFEEAFRKADTYQVSTPFGTVTITQLGRQITFQLYADVRRSIHHKALFSYYQQLLRRGITRINVAHLHLQGLTSSINLKRGKAILDLAYIHNGNIYEIELKTHREVGQDLTARQLTELAKYCTNLTVVVPRQDMEDMHTILTMIGLDQRIHIDSYEILHNEEDPHEG